MFWRRRACLVVGLCFAGRLCFAARLCFAGRLCFAARLCFAVELSQVVCSSCVLEEDDDHRGVGSAASHLPPAHPGNGSVQEMLIGAARARESNGTHGRDEGQRTEKRKGRRDKCGGKGRAGARMERRRRSGKGIRLSSFRTHSTTGKKGNGERRATAMGGQEGRGFWLLYHGNVSISHPYVSRKQRRLAQARLRPAYLPIYTLTRNRLLLSSLSFSLCLPLYNRETHLLPSCLPAFTLMQILYYLTKTLLEA